MDALKTAFQRVGTWPLDPTVFSTEELSKGADAPIQDVELVKLTKRLIPRARKDMTCPVVVNGTLSTAGRGTVLTAPEIKAALDKKAAAKEAAKSSKEARKRARDTKAADKNSKDVDSAKIKCASMDAKEAATRRELWENIGLEAPHRAASRLRTMGLALPSAFKTRRRLAAARSRISPVSPNVLWLVVASEAARVGRHRPLGRFVAWGWAEGLAERPFAQWPRGFGPGKHMHVPDDRCLHVHESVTTLDASRSRVKRLPSSRSR